MQRSDDCTPWGAERSIGARLRTARAHLFDPAVYAKLNTVEATACVPSAVQSATTIPSCNTDPGTSILHRPPPGLSPAHGHRVANQHCGNVFRCRFGGRLGICNPLRAVVLGRRPKPQLALEPPTPQGGPSHPARLTVPERFIWAGRSLNPIL